MGVLLPTRAVLVALPCGLGDDRPDRVIRVSGEGVAAAPPDTATIHTGVVTGAASATEALAANGKAMEAVPATLETNGVAELEIQTTAFDLRPVHKRAGDGRVLPETAGYEVTNRARVRVRKLDDLGTVLDAVVKAGGNQVSGIEFGVSDPAAALDTARRADVLAKEAGVKVGRVVSIQEHSLHRPQPELQSRALAADAAAVPVATRREEFRVTVQVAYSVADGPCTDFPRSPMLTPQPGGAGGNPVPRVPLTRHLPVGGVRRRYVSCRHPVGKPRWPRSPAASMWARTSSAPGRRRSSSAVATPSPGTATRRRPTTSCGVCGPRTPGCGPSGTC
ncbi:MAG: hypothetical protein C0501_14605 [Isosphaera sp.]|nr:hypothetical protein [Isosphaera sp.]